MNKSIALLFAILFLTTAGNSQTIVNENGKMGLVSASGQPVLRCVYDSIIRFEQFQQGTEYYILRSGSQYGFYNSKTDFHSGCIYDSVYSRYQILYLRNGNRLGFVAPDSRDERGIVEPRYTELFPIRNRDDKKSNDLGKVYMGDSALSVRIDSLWGVVSYSDGQVRIPCKFRNEIVVVPAQTSLWVSPGDKNCQQTYINSATGAEFRSAPGGIATFYENNTILMIQDDWWRDTDTLHTQLFNFSTGERTWHHQSTAHRLKVTFYASEHIVAVEEHFDKELSDYDKVIFSFYDARTGTRVFNHLGDGDDRIHAYAEDGYLHVHIYKWSTNRTVIERTIKY